jgi:hypothetical protein
MVGEKLILALKIIVNEWTFGYGIKINSSMNLVTHVILYDCEIWGGSISK